MIYSIIITALFNILFSVSILFANTIDDKLNNINQIPLDEKIAQMLILGFSGSTVNEEIRSYITEYKIGGVILFNSSLIKNKEPNIINLKQVRALNNQLQKLSEIPLFISIDQEGGLVSRLNNNNGFGSFVSHSEMGNVDNLNYTYDEAFKIARAIKKAGFNLNFAPVVDVNINPNNPVIGSLNRSFSVNEKKVVMHANAYIKAHDQLSLITSLKHYPGHGSSDQDSHKNMVDITNSYVPEKEIYPYRKMIENGYQGTIMVAHVINKKIDKYPASLSYTHVTENLRKKLGFQGVIITDDLKMSAIEDNWSLEEALVLSINAGNDIIIYSNNLGEYNPDFLKDAIQIIKKNVYQGKININTINESYIRILNLKKKYILS